MENYSGAAVERAMKIEEVLLRATAGKIMWWQAAELIGISERQLRRLRKRYEDSGYDGLLDRRRGVPSSKRVAKAQARQVLDLYREQYFDLNVRHFHEKLIEEHRIGLNYTWVKQALQGAGLVKRKSKRGVHHRRRERRPLPWRTSSNSHPTTSLSIHASVPASSDAPVVDGAAVAYHSANTIHERRTDYDAIADFDKTDPVYNPRIIHPLLTHENIEVRLAVLKAFQCYVQTLVEITSGLESPALDDASKSVGSSLANLGNTLVPVSSTSATTSSTSSEPALTISQGTQNALSTGANALGQFLVYRAIKKDLPQKVKDRASTALALCSPISSLRILLCECLIPSMKFHRCAFS
jgi:transposase